MRLYLCVFALLALAPRPAGATGQCTPEDEPSEQYLNHPDYLPDFAGGRLGVVRGSFARPYLVIAYLTLEGIKLDAATQRAVVDLWRARNYVARDRGKAPAETWLAVRKQIAGAPSPKPLELYWGDRVCLPDAFFGAVRTVERLRKSGFAAGALATWAEAQDEVFANCVWADGVQATPNLIPAELPDSAPAAARAERAYQIAAAHLYAGHHVIAAARFARIAEDATSPWAPWGAYLAARAHLRRALIDNDATGLDAARPLLDKLAADASAPEMQRRAQALLSVIAMRREPGARLQRAAASLRQPGPTFVNDLTDLLIGLDALLKDGSDEQHLNIDDSVLATLLANDELTDWVVSLQGKGTKGADVLDHLLRRYDEKHDVAWLVAALSAVDLGNARARELLAAADKIARTSPAYDTLTYASLRLLSTSKLPADRAAFHKRVDAELTARASDPPSSLLNQLLDWRLDFSATLPEGLAVATRFVLGDEGCGFAVAATAPAPARAKAAREVSWRMAAPLQRWAPLARLEAILADAALPEAVRPGLTHMTWERALLLGEHDPAARALADKLEPGVRADPKLTAALNAAHAAASPEAARFELARYFLADGWLAPTRLAPPPPGYSLGEFLLWCPVSRDNEGADPLETMSPYAASHDDAAAAAKANGERFFTADERKQASAELTKIQALGGGFVVVVRWTLDYAALHPDDPRLPQLLFDINRRSRTVSCGGDASKKAYLFMHKAYPDHPLTKKVQYWY